MGEVLRVGKPAIDIRVRRSGQARRFVLRVAGRGAAPVMTVPAGASLAEARRFASAQEAWLRRTLAALPQPVAVTVGTRLPVAGREAVVVPGERARHDPEAGLLMLPGPGNRLAAQAAAFLHEAARAACSGAVAHYAGLVGRRHGAITLRDPRSRWGSCTSRGDLMFSWRLAMAPPEVLRYVVAHEVAHLVELNHSPRFWSLVERLDPGHAPAREWLRRRGADLHGFDFRPPRAATEAPGA
jgi:predicted metal-dependent hydrolase